MSSAATARSALALAERAYDVVQVSPRRAQTLAERALACAQKERDFEAQVAALHTLSWAQHVRGDPRTFATARAGIRIGERHGYRRRTALLRRRLALSLANAGRGDAARREIDAAVAELEGHDRATSVVFQIAIHRNAYGAGSDRDGEVLAASVSALRALTRPEDAVWRARILYNRGVFYWERGDGGAAERDFRRAFALYRSVGAAAAAIDAAAALAAVDLLRGDVVGCLEQVGRVRSTLPAGQVCFALDEAEAQALAQARLIPEAEAAFRRHLELCVRARRLVFASAVLVDLASMSLAAGRTEVALDAAGRLTRVFAARRSAVGVARACAVRLRGQLVLGNCRPSSLHAGLRAASALKAAGWRREELRLRLLLVRVALAVGSPRDARRELELARPLRTLGTAADRVELHLARALVLTADGDRNAARRSLGDGLRLLEEYRAAFGAAELRATVSSLGVELAQLGLRLVLADGAPSKVLEWAERARGNALRLPAVAPPSDPRLRASLTELRLTASRIREAEQRGRPAPGLAARQVELESAIRAITRRAHGRGGPVRTVPTPSEASRVLGDRALVEYLELDGVLRALTLSAGRLTVHELGAGAADELEWLRFSLGRLAGMTTSKPQRAAALASAGAAATALDRLLLEPLLPAIGGAPLVIVPTGALHALPWAALPSVRGRPIVVAPSLSTWLDLMRRRRPRRRRIALVAGPGLPHASREVRHLAELYPDASLLSSRAATASSVAAALDGAAVAHVACHGRFRADSPLFSSLELADGPLTALDLQRLRRAPDVLVLSACDLALSDRFPGDELLGMAAVMLGMGTRTIVASVVPVRDAVARRLMLTFHRELLAGARPAAALAKAQATLGAGSGFVCLGSG
jgi:hypothetical protein